MAFVRITNGFERLSDPNLIVRSQDIIAAMDGNTNFATPIPALSLVSGAINNFILALEKARTGNRYDILIKNTRRNELVELLHKLGYYVLFTAEGDYSKAASSGFNIAKNPEPVQITKPSKITVTNGLNPGDLVVHVSTVKGAKSYVHQYTTDPTLAESSWVKHTCSASKCVFTGMQQGTKYYCRVAVIGGNEQSVYSDVISRVAI